MGTSLVSGTPLLLLTPESTDLKPSPSLMCVTLFIPLLPGDLATTFLLKGC